MIWKHGGAVFLRYVAYILLSECLLKNVDYFANLVNSSLQFRITLCTIPLFERTLRNGSKMSLRHIAL